MAALVTSKRRAGLIKHGCKQGPQPEWSMLTMVVMVLAKPQAQWQARSQAHWSMAVLAPAEQHAGMATDKAHKESSPSKGQAVSTTASKNHKQSGHRLSWYQPRHRHSYKQGAQAESSVLGQAMLQARTTSRVVNNSNCPSTNMTAGKKRGVSGR